jgi:hypothetical protein
VGELGFKGLGLVGGFFEVVLVAINVLVFDFVLLN